MGAGFSRACVNDCTSSAVRPNVLCANKGKWILGVEGPEITAEGGDEAEVLPGSGECGEGERKMKRVIDPCCRAQRRSLSTNSRTYLLEIGAPIVLRGGPKR